MFDTHVDTLYVWIALGAVSVATLGVVAELPTTAPPDATRAAAAIDEVATSPPGSVVRRDVTADRWRLDDGQLGLRNDGGSGRASVRRSAVPCTSDRLRAVLDGRAPEQVYGSPVAFQRAVERGETGHETWQPAPDALTVRRVVWEGVDVTLVG